MQGGECFARLMGPEVLSDQVMCSFAVLLLGVYIGCLLLLVRIKDHAALWLLAPLFTQLLFAYYYWQVTAQALDIGERSLLLQSYFRPALLILWIFVALHVIFRTHVVYMRRKLVAREQ